MVSAISSGINGGFAMASNNSENSKNISRDWESFWDAPGAVLSGLTKNQEVHGALQIAEELDHVNSIVTGMTAIGAIVDAYADANTDEKSAAAIDEANKQGFEFAGGYLGGVLGGMIGSPGGPFGIGVGAAAGTLKIRNIFGYAIQMCL